MKKATLLFLFGASLILAPLPAQGGFLCGGENELPCILPPYGCHTGLAVGVDLRCHENLGGHNELAYAFFICDPWHTINPLWIDHCLSCGGEWEIACLNFDKDTVGCEGERILAADLLCHSSCGGDGEVACAGLVCDPGHTYDLLSLSCVECGGEGQLPCANFVTGDIGCDPGFTLDLLGLSCTECGDDGQLSCLGVCDAGHTLDPGTLLCAQCGGDGQYQCLNFVTGDYFCDEGHTMDPNNFLRCIECGDYGQFMCLNFMTSDFGCDYPWLRVPWIWEPDNPDAFWDYLAAPQYFLTCDLAWDPIAEPDCDVYSGGALSCEAAPQPQDEPLFGIADTHAHPLSNLAFGGAMLWGSPYDERGINAALAWGDVSWDFSTETGDLLVDMLTESLGLPNIDISFPNPVTPNGTLVHDAPMALLTSALLGEGGVHSPKGPPDFSNWPNWDTTMHQQTYYKWLQRAYKGGLRLMVMLAVNNEVICRLSHSIRPDFGCDDMPAVDRQLEAARDLQDFIDTEHGGPGEGWFRIVYTPQEARNVIREGKMAVVLGIEVDALFGCKPGSICGDDYIREELDYYYDLGVRHVFPIHLHDNLFGGTAIYHWLWPWANIVATGDLMALEPCGFLPEDSALKYNYAPAPGVESGHDSTWLEDWADAIEEATGFPIWPTLEGAGVTAYCNPRNLTDKGRLLIDEMMKRNYIIDVDHMSLETINEVFSMAEEKLYPLVSGHSFLFEKPITEFGTYGFRSENHRTPAQIERIRNLGGIVAPLPPRKEGSSTHDYAEMYRYASDKMQGGPYGPDNPGIGFGSDWGAMFLMTAPRCPEPDSCLVQECTDPEDPASCFEVDTRLAYPFTIEGVEGEFYRQQTGERTFDFNSDGLAHIGLLPDFLADLRNVGLSDDELKPLFRSAETYILMWEMVENEDRDGDGLPTGDDNCPYEGNPGQDDCDGDGIGDACDPDFPCNLPPDCSGAAVADQFCDSACQAVISGTEVTGVTDPDGDPLVISVIPATLLLGSNTVSVSADDGNGGTCQIDITVNLMDHTPPEIAAPPDITVHNDPGTCTAFVSYAEPVGSDNCPGVSTACTGGLGADSHFPVGTTMETYTATDTSGLASSCSFTVTVSDAELPEITCPADMEVEPSGPSGAPVTYATPVGTDNCAGAATAPTAGLGSGLTFPIGATTESYQTTDVSGNTADCSFTVTVLSPEEVAEKLISETEDLIAEGSLQESHGHGLINQLGGIIRKLESDGPPKPACNKIKAFINHVSGFVNAGKLTDAQGGSLINSALNAGRGAGCAGSPF